jgi:regulator of protease activity HflC (stomatin/prohibitin superfamily)
MSGLVAVRILASSGAEAGIIVGVIAFVIVAASLASSAIRVVTEYERSVFFRLGRVRPEAKGPGVIFRIPMVDRLVKVTLRVEVVDIPPQAVITKDNVTIQVDAVVYFQVVDAVQAVLGVDNFRFASQRIAMTSLRSIIGRHELDNLLAHREDVNNELRTVIAASTHHWGVEVRQVELRDITLPPELLRAMARQAEAERERRAKVIAATGELEASAELSEAAAKLYESPGALQLRALQTLAEVASEHNSTLVFPVPIELLTGYLGRAQAPRPAASPEPSGDGGPKPNGSQSPPELPPQPGSA